MSRSDSMPRIAFVGLGMMGGPMAGRLAAAGYRLAVYDRNPALTAQFALAHGATACASAADAALQADLAITMLPGSDAVFSSVLGGDGDAGLLSKLQRGSRIIDMSSSDPVRTRDLAQQVALQGCTLQDAPVSGGVRKARDGSLAIMAGGTSEEVERAGPILRTMGATVFHTGAVGSGHAMKALNNYVSAAGLVAAVEALHIGAAFGLDPHTITRVLNASTGRNNTTENKVEQFMLNSGYNSGFSLALMAKDLGIAMDLAAEVGVSALLGDVTLEIWEDALDAAGGNPDHTEMYRLLAPQAPAA